MHDIKRDLSAFADPGTPVIVEKNSAIWEQNGRQRSVDFARSSSGELGVVGADGEWIEYRRFLAGPEMANLRQLASFMLKTARPTAGFIETSAQWRSEDSEAEPVTAAATTLIDRRATTDLPAFSTRVVLVQGEAGSGKTIALRELAYRRAEQYENGEVDQLYFYVDAQGRALSRLEEAMAKDLQDLRSSFSYAAIAPLARNQLIVPIIDGFDELLGSGGYDEAFASLAAFLSTLDGRGSVIASARSAFFDYRNFYDNAERFSRQGSVSYEVDVVRVQPWSLSQVHEYVGEIANSRGRDASDVLEGLDELEQSLDQENRGLLSKPFYAARVADLLLAGASISSTEALLDQLVNAFLAREHRKLLDKNQEPLLSERGHHEFLVLLAEEMWWQESRRIDVRTVQAVAELVAESFNLPPGGARAIVERVSSYAFLSTSESESKALRFEHEVFYGYFLGHKLRDCIERDPTDLKRFLSRALLDQPLAEQAARLIGTDVNRATRAVTAICSVLRPGVSWVIARENGGRLISHIVQVAGSLTPGSVISDAIFKQVRFCGVRMERPVFQRCDFEDVDFSDTLVIAPSFEQCDLRHILIDPHTTRFQDLGPEAVELFYSVTVLRGDDELVAGRLFAPHDIARALARVGVRAPANTDPAGYSEQVEERITVLSDFLRKMERRFYASEEDIKRLPFSKHKEWSFVLAALERHGLVTYQVVQKSGPREDLMKLTMPPEIIRSGEKLDLAIPQEVRDFWRELFTAEVAE